MPNPELWKAALDNNVVGVRRCLTRGDKVNEKGGYRHTTPLIEAVEHADHTVLLMLLGHGVDLEACDDIGCTALHQAAVRGSASCVRILTSLGADINAVNNFR